MKSKLLLLLACLYFIYINTNAQINFQQNSLSDIEKAAISKEIDKTKIPWIKNKGQKHSDVAFYAKTFGGTVFLTHKGEIVYNMSVDSLSSYVFRETFETNKKTLQVSAELPSQTIVNSFIGDDPNKWQNNITTYQTVNLGQIWEGIKVKLNAYGNNIEKLFYVGPGISPEKIQLKLKGAKKIKIAKNGELIIKTTQGNIKFTTPVAYQIIENKKHYVEVAYTKNNKTYGFEVGNYNPDYELVIDPLIASTFVGGTGRDDSWCVVLDDSGNIFVTGETHSTFYPTTAGAYNTSVNGAYDVFISKFSPDLQTLLISTFVGGSNSDYSRYLAFDSNSNIYITGNTWSNDFPMAGTPYDNSLSGNYDVFVAKFNSDLSSLLASTYIGGTNVEKAYSIAIDGTDSIFITGFVYGIGYPTTSGAYNETFNGNIDVFVSKLNSDLSILSASTLIGGSESDISYSLRLDSSGNVYITGETYSSYYPSTAGAYDPSHNGSYDAFVSKFTSDLSTLSASTFIGGTDTDYGYSIKLDDFNNVYVTGHTKSDDFPTSASAYDNIHNGSRDVFVSKFNSDLSTLSASTFIGGSGYEECYSIDLDTSGNVFITGYTGSTDFPTSTTAYDNSHNGDISDIFISKFNSDLSSLFASTFLGGAGEDVGTEIVVDVSGNVFVTGYTTSSNYPVSSGAYDDSYAGDDDVFISKLDNYLGSLPIITSQPENQTICEGNSTNFSITVTGVESYQWQVNESSGFINITNGSVYSGATTDTLTITNATADIDGYQYQCIVSSVTDSIISDTATLFVDQSVLITTQPISQSLNINEDAVFTVIAEGDIINYQWYKDDSVLNNNTHINGAITHQLTINKITNDDAGDYTCEITGTDACGNITSNIATLSVISSIKNLANESIKIFPNPSTGIINIIVENPIKIKELKITNMIGKTVFCKKDMKSKENIDLSKFGKGIFLISLHTDKELIKTKILIQ